MKCTRCRAKAEVELRSHNAGFCRPCYLFYFRRQVERAIAAEHMFTHEERLLVAVSGGTDSLALWDVLAEGGYRTTGLYLGLGIGTYSDRSHDKAVKFAEQRGLELRVVSLREEGPGLAVPDIAAATRRVPCSACGTMKRHYFDTAALAGDFDVLEDLTQAESLECLRKAVSALPEAYREVVVLCELEEMPYLEAAAVLKCSPGTIASRLARAKAMLKTKLRVQGCVR